MPQRFLKPGITSSEKWNACSWMAQSFYIRLITLVDDYGRHDASPRLLRSLAFPLSEDLRTEHVLALMQELETQQLAHFYKAGEKEYVQLTGWSERPRSPSRYPEKTDACQQMFATAVKCCPPKSESEPSPSGGVIATANPASKCLQPSANGNGYPLPLFEKLPQPLYASTASKMIKAVEEQIAKVKKIASEHREPIMAKTAEGTEYRKGWRLPSAAEKAIEAWELRREQITKALAG